MALPKIPKLKQLEQTSGKTKTIVKGVLIGALALLLGAFGLEATNNDFDLGKLLSGSGLEGSKLARDENGNIQLKRDGSGKFLLENCTKDLYNCSNFKTQQEAQEVFDNCGGKGDDVNNLDGDKDNIACESLPKGS